MSLTRAVLVAWGVVGASLMLATAGCTSVPPYYTCRSATGCGGNAQCDLATGGCYAPDPQCPAGRYEPNAPPAVAGKCVGTIAEAGRSDGPLSEASVRREASVALEAGHDMGVGDRSLFDAGFTDSVVYGARDAPLDASGDAEATITDASFETDLPRLLPDASPSDAAVNDAGCPADSVECPGVGCMPTAADDDHCGFQGSLCSATQACASGTCVTPMQQSSSLLGAINGSSIASDGATLFVGEGTTVYSCAEPGCSSPQPVADLSGFGTFSIAAVAVDAQSFFVAGLGIAPDAGTGVFVYSCDKAAGLCTSTSAALVMFAPGVNNPPSNLDVDANGDPAVVVTGVGLFRCAAGNCNPPQIIPGSANAQFLRMDPQGTIYWDAAPGAIHKATMPAGADTTIIPTITRFATLAVDGTYVYYVDMPTTPEIVRTTADGANRTVLLSSILGNGFHLAADSDAVYFTFTNAGNTPMEKLSLCSLMVHVLDGGVGETADSGPIVMDQSDLYYARGATLTWVEK
jgi:hypothetical protein